MKSLHNVSAVSDFAWSDSRGSPRCLSDERLLLWKRRQDQWSDSSMTAPKFAGHGSRVNRSCA